MSWVFHLSPKVFLKSERGLSKNINLKDRFGPKNKAYLEKRARPQARFFWPGHNSTRPKFDQKNSVVVAFVYYCYVVVLLLLCCCYVVILLPFH